MEAELLAYEHQGLDGFIGELVLNRPQALNAVTMNMSQKFEYILNKWQAQDAIKAVIIRGAGSRAFCAGGDLKTLLQYIESNRQPGGKEDFLRHQYRLIHQFATYSKPLVVLCHGLTFGGGAGIMAHAPFRLCSPECQFAMPETRIGFVPDVGAMHFLNQCPGSVGTFMALTSYQASASDLTYCGLIEGILPQTAFEPFIEQLLSQPLSSNTSQVVNNTVKSQTVTSDTPSRLAEWQEDIDACFSHQNLAEIMASLAAGNTPWHQQQLDILQQRSPHSLKLTLAGLRRAQGKSLAECLNLEYVMSWSCLRHPDLKAGITSAIITKDHQPQWCPKQHQEVDDAAIAKVLEDSSTDPLDLLGNQP